MGFRFRHSVRLFPRVRLIVNQTDINACAAARGTTFNFGALASSLDIGTGSPDCQFPGEIQSKAIAQLLSTDLQGLKDLINEAARQRAALQSDYRAALSRRKSTWRQLRRREQPPLRWFLKSSIPKVRRAFEEAEIEAKKVLAALSASEIKIQIALGEDARNAWAEVEHSHAALARSEYIWDVTSTSQDDRARERPTISSAVTRYQVQLQPITEGIVSGSPGVRLANADRDDLDIFGGFILMRAKGVAEYAVMDYREVLVEATDVPFIESETVPADSHVIGYARANSRSNGSPDIHFKNNDRLPIAKYGQVTLTSANGLHQAYLVSNCEAAFRFADAMLAFKAALIRQAADPEHSSAPLPPTQVVSGPEPDKPLPELQRVSGAYELILIPIALVAALFAVSTWREHLPTSPQIISDLPSRPAEARIATSLPSTQLSVAPRPVAPLPEFGNNAANQAQPRERLVVLQHANVRSGPTKSSPSLRVAPKGTIVTVFKRDGTWIEVGDELPWGWVNTVLLKKL